MLGNDDTTPLLAGTDTTERTTPLLTGTDTTEETKPLLTGTDAMDDTTRSLRRAKDSYAGIAVAILARTASVAKARVNCIVRRENGRRSLVR